MALVTHPVQGSYTTFPARPVSVNKGIQIKRFATTLPRVVKTVPLLTCKSCLSFRAPLVKETNAKFLRIAAFKGRAKNDESGSRSNGSKSTEKSVKLSYLQESENTFSDSPEIEDAQLSYNSKVERISGSLAIQNLFKNWLTLLRTSPSPSPSPSAPPPIAADEMPEGSDPEKEEKVHDVVPIENGDNLLRSMWGFFWTMDASIKIPLLLFTPLYLVVNVAYGAQVSKELTPLWIFGPLIIALYVKIIRWIAALYVFTFKQTVKVVKNAPTYYVVVYTYMADGKLKDLIYTRLWKPVMDVNNKEFRKELKVWMVERFQEYKESIWPTYCRTLRFVKKANII